MPGGWVLHRQKNKSLQRENMSLHQRRCPCISSNASVQAPPQPAPVVRTSPAPFSRLHLDSQDIFSNQITEIQPRKSCWFQVGRQQGQIACASGSGEVGEGWWSAWCLPHTHPAPPRDLSLLPWAGGGTNSVPPQGHAAPSNGASCLLSPGQEGCKRAFWHYLEPGIDFYFFTYTIHLYCA